MSAPDALRFPELGPPPASTTVSVDAEEQEPPDDSDTAELLGGQRRPHGFWTLEYYQTFFDVDTGQVLERIKGSVTPLPGKNFVRHRLRNNPDLYGPFWICTTLALAVAGAGNLSHLPEKQTSPSYHYSPRFHHVTAAVTLIFCYAGLVPLALWGFLRWRRSPAAPTGTYSFLETVCAYGYSLAAYVPAAVLWLIPAPWLQWVVLAVTALLSATVLVVTFWPPARAAGRVTALAVAAAVGSLHALLAVGCKLYFYQRPASTGAVPSALTTPGAAGLRVPQLPGTNGSLLGAHPAW